jgi:hypothetical protein
MVLRISIMIPSLEIDFMPAQCASASATYHSWISTGPFCEARDFAVHLDPRQRVITKNLPPRLCDGRIVKRPDI